MANVSDPLRRGRLAAKIYSAHRCCTDEGLTTKICDHVTCASQLAEGPVRDLLQHGSAHLGTMIAGLERQNAYQYHMTVGDKRRPVVERVRYEAFIREWKQDFQERGGRIINTVTRERLRQANVVTHQDLWASISNYPISFSGMAPTGLGCGVDS